MREKTIITIVPMVFTGGAAVWLHIRRKEQIRQILCGLGRLKDTAPFPYMEVTMDSLKTVGGKMKAAPQRNEDARNDDMVLYLALCNLYLKNAGMMPLAEIMTRHRELGLPSLESMSRTRRKLQEKYPGLLGGIRVRRPRTAGEEAYRKYAKESWGGRRRRCLLNTEGIISSQNGSLQNGKTIFSRLPVD